MEKQIFLGNETSIKEEPPSFEKEKGCNTTVAIHFIRHADREIHKTVSETPLTKKGVKRCVEFAETLNGNVITGEFSPTERTEETLDTIIEHSPATVKIPPQENIFLKSRCSENFVHRIQQHFLEMHGGMLTPCPDTDVSAIESCATVAGIELYLSFGNDRPDEETPSPVETAAMVAAQIAHAVNMADDLESGDIADCVFVSHDYLVAAFLKEILLVKDKTSGKKRKFGHLSEIGGGIDFLDGPEITVKNNANGKRTITLQFKGQKYDINTDRFNELLQIDSYKDFFSKMNDRASVRP